MPEQLALAGFPDREQRSDRVFLGIFADVPAATHATRIRQSLCAEYRVTGTPVAPDRLHITLVSLGDHDGLPQGLVRAASEAVSAVVAAPFEVVLDHTECFRHTKNNLLVLCGSRGPDKLRSFREALVLALMKAGLGGCIKSAFKPHMTLLYSKQLVPEEAVDPVSWTVREFVLVHSLLGQTKHIPLGRWPLHGQPPRK